nr:DUF6086 family protein [Streptomyces sp. YIM 130001]
MFASQVTFYQAELVLSSGIGPMGADECQIDPIALAVFVDALLARHGESRHAVMATLPEGFVATMLTLAETAGVEVNWPGAERAESGTLETTSDPHAGEWTAALRQKSRELARHMTT